MQNEEGDGEDLRTKLTTMWPQMAEKNNVTLQFMADNLVQQVSDAKGRPSLMAFFNKKLDINRFFIEDSEGQTNPNAAAGNDMPKVEGSGLGDGNDGGSGLFEDALDDALCVYVSGDANQDLLGKNDKLIMFYVDLENEEIVEKQNEENKQMEDEEGGGGGGDQVGESKHPILLN